MRRLAPSPGVEYTIGVLDHRALRELSALLDDPSALIAAVPGCLRGCFGEATGAGMPPPVVAVGAAGPGRRLVAAAWLEPCGQPLQARLGLVTTQEARRAGLVPLVLAELGEIARQRGLRTLCANVVASSPQVVDDLAVAGLRLRSALPLDGTTEITVNLDAGG